MSSPASWERRGDQVPERVRVAADLVDPRPGQRVLEIGCGAGVLTDVLCRRGATVVAIDRSATAVEKARHRNAEHLAAGYVELHEVALADLRYDGPRFDAIVGVDVNSFWTGSAEEEVLRVTELLAPDGQVVLVHAPPTGSGTHRAAWLVPAALQAGGLVTEVQHHGDLICITARRGTAA
ncbi:cyclopropane-fatty-acyl-phospholipid synthase family protein [Actinotalea sp. Marseille-Q4924]|uniref:SAM-dependent methyltransferase n=1 Tax=Actinotalea sp. Marseille-Q4924 TaxID=2866571 RepID=UPI001CE43C3A|nr:class I SAM-dependent methyltransferase [Actinotalea sp. Marseille-Q4924]